MRLVLATIVVALASTSGASPYYQAVDIFPPVDRQTHGAGVVECPNGDLLASWYEDLPNAKGDSAIFGARKRKSDLDWSKPFPMADRRGFPDCNTCMMVDDKGELWLFWPTIIADSWESCLTNYRVASDYESHGVPKWNREGIILLKPENFRDRLLQLLGDRELKPPRGAKGGPAQQRKKLDDPLYQRLGWAPRCKPTLLPSGRIVLPLYSDTFSMSIMAISDDEGATWYASQPLIGFGNIQPTVLRRNDGNLVAYMRENGNRGCIRKSESKDDGLTWGSVEDAPLPNPGSGIDGVRLTNGHWALIYNDSQSSRSTLAVAISADEGRTWSKARHLEKRSSGKYHYPAVIQSRDDKIHIVYSRFVPGQGAVAEPSSNNGAMTVGNTIKHVVINEEWVLQSE